MDSLAAPGRSSSGQVGEPAALSLGKLAPGQHEYYLDTVAKGADALASVLAHRHPATF